MNQEAVKIKYFAYPRKSSEQEDRQVVSIESQKRELADVAERDGLTMIKIFDESHSAKYPGRPIFNDMLRRIEKGEANALLVWNASRISRNAVDTGQVIHLLDTGKLLEVRTPSQVFRNTPNDKFLLNLFCSQAKLENDNKGEDVKRGLKTKAQMGIYPVPATMGYMNDKYAERGNKTILPDPERFDLVRKLFDVMLTGNYTAPEVLDMANNQWNLRSPKGKRISRSTIYNIFTRPFYYGEYEYPVGSGKWYTGIHKPMITRDEYDRIQFLLGRNGKPRPKGKHDIAYRGPMRCAECGALIIGEDKYKKLAKGGTNHYVYYHCTKRKKPDCGNKAIEEKILEQQIAIKVKEFKIPDDFRKWALTKLKEMNHKEVDDREKIYGNQKKNYEACILKIDNLIDMRAAQEIDEEEFRNRKAALLLEKKRLFALLETTDRRVENWLEIADRGFEFAEKAVRVFSKAREDNIAELKKEVFTGIGSNYFLNDGKLMITLDELLLPIEKVAAEACEISEKVELLNKQGIPTDSGEIYSTNPKMLGDRDSNPDTLRQRQMSYH